MELFMNKNSPSPHLTKYFLKNKNYISPSAIWQLKFENNTWKISFYLWIFKQKLKIENFTFSIFNFQIKFEILKNFGFKLKTKWHFWCTDSQIFQFFHGDIILISSSNSMFQCARESIEISKYLILSVPWEFEWSPKDLLTMLLPPNVRFNISEYLLGNYYVSHTLLLQVFLIDFCLFCSKIRKRDK